MPGQAMNARPPDDGAAMERRSQLADAARIDQAAQRFKALSLAEQMALARRLCETRQQDYTRMIGSAVAMHAGFKRRCAEDGHEYIHRQACVVFVVRGKWSATGQAPDEAQRVPAHLLTTWVNPVGEAVLVAVPTDVQAQERFGNIEAQAASGIEVFSQIGKDFGVATCLVKCGALHYVLAPLHVMSPGSAAPAGATEMRPAPSATEATQSTQPALVSTAHGGRLADSAEASFDVQWAKVNNLPRLRSMLAPQAWSSDMPWVDGPAALHQLIEEGAMLFILLPDNHPKSMQIRGPAEVRLSHDESSFDINYLVNGIKRRLPHLAMEFQLEAGRSTMAGDSGSPVVAVLIDGSLSLVGMHIAGNPDFGTSYVMPAWRLMSASFHVAMSASMPGANFRLVTV